jgi:hypothetical protein
MRIVWFFLILPFLAFAGEKYGVYDLQGNRVSTFEAERHELPEKIQQIISNHPKKKLYISSLQKGKTSKPSSRYRFKTGSYIEASRKETFAICPSDNKTEGTWISEHSVSLNAENCVSVQAPDIAGTIDVLFLGNSGRTDTIQVLVDQSYIQMGDYSHKIWVMDPNIAKDIEEGFRINTFQIKGQYESRSYKQNLIVDKTKFIMADAWLYSKIDSNIYVPHTPFQLEREYKNVKLDKFKLPYVVTNVSDHFAWRFANLRSKMEGLDTAYYRIGNDIALDTLASGYRNVSREEWLFLMRAGASTRYYWGDEEWDCWEGKKEDSLKISRYAWIGPVETISMLIGNRTRYTVSASLKPVAQLLPNAFGLYDMVGISRDAKVNIGYSPEGTFLDNIGSNYYQSFRLVRKTPKLHKLEKF